MHPRKNSALGSLLKTSHFLKSKLWLGWMAPRYETKRWNAGVGSRKGETRWNAGVGSRKGETRLDVDPRRDDDASPMSSYGCMLRPTWMISSLWHKSKFNFEFKKRVKIQFRFFFNQIIMFPCSSTLEDLSIDVSDTNVGLILTKLRRFSSSSKFEFRTFLKKNHILGFHGVVLVKTFPLMYQLPM